MYFLRYFYVCYNMETRIKLKDFLKKFTVVSTKFINEFFVFYDLCENDKYGISMEKIMKYLDIKERDHFFKRLRDNYTENTDYVVKKNNKSKKDGNKTVEYYVSIDTFMKICMRSNAEKSQKVREYFIILHKFINYYTNEISDAILQKIEKRKKCVYIILINDKKNIYKLGKTQKELRIRLRNYAIGMDSHPDIKFIMLVDDPNYVENCAKHIMKKYEHVKNHEKYKVDIDYIKKTINNCVDLKKQQDLFENNNDTQEAYIIFDDFDDDRVVQSKKQQSKKKQSKKKQLSKPLSKQSKKKQLSKSLKKQSKKQLSKPLSKKLSKPLSKQSSKPLKKQSKKQLSKSLKKQSKKQLNNQLSKPLKKRNKKLKNI